VKNVKQFVASLGKSLTDLVHNSSDDSSSGTALDSTRMKDVLKHSMNCIRRIRKVVKDDEVGLIFKFIFFSFVIFSVFR
jgi:hypothetical protein